MRVNKLKKTVALSGAGAEEVENVDPVAWEYYEQLAFFKDALQNRR